MATLTLSGVYNQERVDLLTKILMQSDINRRFAIKNNVSVSMKPYSITDHPTMEQLAKMLDYVETKYKHLQQALKLKMNGTAGTPKENLVADEVSERIERILDETMTEQCSVKAPSSDFDGDEISGVFSDHVPTQAVVKR